MSTPIKPDALLAGATGRTGEALLNALLASNRYGRIYLLTNRPIRSSAAGVEHWCLPAPLNAADLAAIKPPVARDVFIMSFADRLHSARDKAVHALEPNLTKLLATAAVAAGAERLFLVCPIAAQAQMAGFKHFFAGGDTTLTLANLPYKRIVILLPTESGPAKAVHGFWAKCREAYLSQFRLMLPQSAAPFTPGRFCEAVLQVATEEANGLTVLDAQALHEKLKANKTSKRLVF